MKKALLIVVILVITGFSFAGITNITKVAELSQTSVADYIPFISPNELEIYFLRATDIFDPSTQNYYYASRTTTTDPFSGITNSYFSQLISPSGQGALWVSEDGLRIYYCSSRYGDSNLFFSSRTSSPNILYFATYTNIFKIEANQTILTPVNWYTYPTGYVYDMIIDKNGDVIYAGADLDYYKVVKVDKDTKAETIVADNLDTSLSWPYYSTLSLVINPLNEDIFGLYSVPSDIGYTIYDYFAIYKLEKQGGGTYTPMNYVVSQQVFGDPDVDPYTNFYLEQLTAPANGFAIDPSGTYLYITNGNNDENFSYYDVGSMNIIKILTSTATKAENRWEMYK